MPKRPPVRTSYKPGQSGNPGGRPKNAESVTYHIRQLLSEVGADGTLNARAVAEKLLALAITDDNVPALREIIDRADGKPPQELTHKGDAEHPVVIRAPDRSG